MLPDRVSNPEPLTYERGALPIALRGPAAMSQVRCFTDVIFPTSPTCNYIYNIFDIARHCGVYFERFLVCKHKVISF